MRNKAAILRNMNCGQEDLQNIINNLVDEDVETSISFCDLYEKNILVLNEEIDSKITEKFALPLINMLEDDSVEEIHIYINSVGGSVLDSFYICNLIDQAEKPIYITTLGYAFSAAGIIGMAGKNNPLVVRRCYPLSFFLYHSGSTTLTGRVQDVDGAYKLQKTIEQMCKNYTLEHSNMTNAQYNKFYANDTYFTAQQMYDLGIVDEIIGVTPRIVIERVEDEEVVEEVEQ